MVCIYQEKLEAAEINTDEEVFEDAKSSPESECAPSPTWTNLSDKHIFVLSEAGKPIYSLHGEEEMMVSAAYVKKMSGVRNDEDDETGNRMSSFNNAVSASS